MASTLRGAHAGLKDNSGPGLDGCFFGQVMTTALRGAHAAHVALESRVTALTNRRFIRANVFFFQNLDEIYRQNAMILLVRCLILLVRFFIYYW